ncbi:unnamed protein product [Amoebophrya sp. A120]|nr:unnamed protein product [Amoebophrya sp. A120]|eukprot:GSA120T00004433001.1
MVRTARGGVPWSFSAAVWSAEAILAFSGPPPRPPQNANRLELQSTTAPESHGVTTSLFPQEELPFVSDDQDTEEKLDQQLPTTTTLFLQIRTSTEESVTSSQQQEDTKNISELVLDNSRNDSWADTNAAIHRSTGDAIARKLIQGETRQHVAGKRSLLGPGPPESELQFDEDSSASADEQQQEQKSDVKLLHQGTSHAQDANTFGFDNDELKYSVFRIKSVSPQNDFLQPSKPPESGVSLGSGFLVRTNLASDTFDPLIITNAHVVSNALKVELQLLVLSSESFPAKTVQICTQFDIALLRFEKPEKFKAALDEGSIEVIPLQFVSKTPPMGEKVLAVGFPLGQNLPTLSGGEIAGNQEVDGNICIQSTAPISPGNSGGPLLLEREKKVVGINFAKATGGAENVNYVIPYWRVLQNLGLYDHNQEISSLPKDDPGYVEVPARFQVRIPSLEARIAFGSPAIYDLDPRCNGHGVLLTEIDERSMFTMAQPPVLIGSYLVRVGDSVVDKFGQGKKETYLSDQMSYENLFFMQGDLDADCNSCGTSCPRCDALYRNVTFVTCSDGQEKTHTVSLAWNEIYNQGIKYIPEPAYAPQDLEYESFGGMTFNMLSTNLLEALIAANPGMPTVARWLLPNEIIHPHVALAHVKHGSEAGETLVPGLVIKRVNGCLVTTMTEFRKFFIPKVARESDCGATTASAAGGNALVLSQSASSGSFLQREYEKNGKDASIMDNIWSIESDLGVFYALRFNETLAKELNDFCQDPLFSALDRMIAEAAMITNMGDLVSDKCMKHVTDILEEAQKEEQESEEESSTSGNNSTLAQKKRNFPKKGLDWQKTALIEKSSVAKKSSSSSMATSKTGVEKMDKFLAEKSHSSVVRSNTLLRAAEDVMRDAKELKNTPSNSTATTPAPQEKSNVPKPKTTIEKTENGGFHIRMEYPPTGDAGTSLMQREKKAMTNSNSNSATNPAGGSTDDSQNVDEKKEGDQEKENKPSDVAEDKAKKSKIPKPITTMTKTKNGGFHLRMTYPGANDAGGSLMQREAKAISPDIEAEQKDEKSAEGKPPVDNSKSSTPPATPPVTKKKASIPKPITTVRKTEKGGFHLRMVYPPTHESGGSLMQREAKEPPPAPAPDSEKDKDEKKEEKPAPPPPEKKKKSKIPKPITTIEKTEKGGFHMRMIYPGTNDAGGATSGGSSFMQKEKKRAGAGTTVEQGASLEDAVVSPISSLVHTVFGGTSGRSKTTPNSDQSQSGGHLLPTEQNTEEASAQEGAGEEAASSGASHVDEQNRKILMKSSGPLLVSEDIFSGKLRTHLLEDEPMA